MSVELGEGPSRASFEADVLDFTRAGASMRAPYLPDIGSQLECRFRCGPSASLVSARGEVVWAQLEGESSGEFGLAFTALDARTEWLIEEMLAEPIRKRDSDPEPDSITQLELEGSAEPIAARMARRESGSAVFEQHLDLLSLGRGVRAHAPGARDRSGSIAGVELRMVGNVPMLAVTVNFEEETAAAAAADSAEEDPFDVNVPHDTVADMTAPDLTDTGELRSITLTEFHLGDRGGTVHGLVAPRAEAASEVRAGRGDAAQGFSIQVASDDEVCEPADTEEDDEPDTRGDLRGRIDALFAPLRSAVQARHTALDERMGDAREQLRQWWARVAQDGFALYHRELGARFGAVRRLALRRRRTTASPSGVQRVTPGLPPVRVAILAAAVAVVGCLALYAFLGRGPEHEVQPVLTAEVAEPEVASEPAPPLEEEAATAEPSAPARPLAAALARRRVIPTPPGEGAVAAVEEGAPASASPAVVDAAPRPAPRVKPRFGAAQVPMAKRFPIRMSAPIQALDGKAARDGFTVSVVGAQALDPAGPLAKRYPELISKAQILNQGGAAQLEVRFAKSKQPIYQVSADGSTLYIALRDK